MLSLIILTASCGCLGVAIRGYIGDFYLEWEVTALCATRIIVVIVLDILSAGFIFTVRIISLAVIIFSMSYIAPDKFYSRFILILFSFIISMVLLIISPNLMSILLG